MSSGLIKYYTLLLRLLQSAQSIWQFSAIVLPPLLQGVMWSACIFSISKCFLHFGQMPFCRSYAVLAIFEENALRFKCLSSPSSKYSYTPEYLLISSSSNSTTMRASSCLGSYFPVPYLLKYNPQSKPFISLFR